MQYNKDSEKYYARICDAYNDSNFTGTATPIYAITQDGVIYDLTGGDEEVENSFENGVLINNRYYKQTYGKDDYLNTSSIKETANIPFYLKTKEFKNGALSKKKSLSAIWFNYDLEGTVNLKIIVDDGREWIKENILEEGKNLTKCVLIPNEIQNVNSYTFEIYGTGNVTIYAIERVDRTHLR